MNARDTNRVKEGGYMPRDVVTCHRDSLGPASRFPLVWREDMCASFDAVEVAGSSKEKKEGRRGKEVEGELALGVPSMEAYEYDAAPMTKLKYSGCSKCGGSDTLCVGAGESGEGEGEKRS